MHGTIVKTEAFIDVETRSMADLRKVGVHIYAQHPTTSVWCVAWAIGDGEINTWLPGQPCPFEIAEHVKKRRPIWAHNSAFERLIWLHQLHAHHGFPLVAYDQWNCTMARAFALALPGSLDSVASVLGLAAKDSEGYAMMLRMAKPRRIEEDGTPVWWDDDPHRLQVLIDYNKHDVHIEREVHRKLRLLSEAERQVWLLDQVINDRGVEVDLDLCKLIRPLVAQALTRLNKEIGEASSGIIGSVNSVAQIVAYCNARGVCTDSIRANLVEEMLIGELPDDVRRVLEIRVEAGKASIKKVDALITACSPNDKRARGLLQYHAASTGRWAGRRVQPHNFKRPTDPDQDTLIALLRTKSVDAIEMVNDSVLDTVSNMLRGLFVARQGCRLYAADYANIEGRVLAWLASEPWKIDAFIAYDRGLGPDIYRLAYARAFHVDIETITSDQRQLGKVMELALGYQGGVGAFQSMAQNYRAVVTDEEADQLKVAWRKAHPNVVQFWRDMEEAAMNAVYTMGRVTSCDKIAFVADRAFLNMRLPSGRDLTYPLPKIVDVMTPWGDPRPALSYFSTLSVSNVGRLVADPANTSSWGRISAYGGLLVENSVQAVARDIMAEAMLRVEAAGYPVVMTVHDEIVAETDKGNVEEFRDLIETRPSWCQDLPIVAKAWSDIRYRKD